MGGGVGVGVGVGQGCCPFPHPFHPMQLLLSFKQDMVFQYYFSFGKQI